MINVPIHSNDWEMLSAYLDGQMAKSEQRRVQDLLTRSAELRAGLEELRRTQAVLRTAPRRRVPHNFTLTPAMAQKARPRFGWGWAPSFGVVSALATVLLVLTFFFQLSPAGMRAISLPAAAPPNAQDQSAQESAPPIIIWNDDGRGSAPAGAGGGIGPEPGADFTPLSTPASLAAPAPATGQPAATSAPAATMAAAIAPTVLADAAPRTAIVQPTATPDQVVKSASQATSNAEAPNSSSPILGVAATEDRGKMFVPTLANPDLYSVRATSAPVVSGFSPVQIALAAIAVATGLAALILWRRSRS